VVSATSWKRNWDDLWVMTYWLRKGDGSIVYALRNPDGSWVEFPAFDEPPAAQPSASAQIGSAMSIRQFLREIGRRGGQARAARHSRAELAAWGRVRYKNKAIG
jgi:hypothetical protein